MSRSEQHLHHSTRDDSIHRPSVTSMPSTANGGPNLFPPQSGSPSSSSMSTSSSPGRLPPSRSDDQLHKTRRKSSVPSAMVKLRSSGHSQSDSTLPQPGSTQRRTSSSTSSVSSGSGVLNNTPRSSLPPPPAATSVASLQSSSAEEDTKSEHEPDSEAELPQPIPNSAILQVSFFF